MVHAGNKPNKIVLQEEYVQLRDQYGGFEDPDPEPYVRNWEAIVELPPQTKEMSCAFIMFSGFHIHYADLIANGRRVAIAPQGGFLYEVT